ncbi:MAG: MFS transporter [Tepidiformaceae bacterium]
MASGWLHRSFPALANPQFRLLFLGTTFAQLAFGMMFVIQGIVAFELTGKNSAVGLVSLGMGTSMLILGPLGGTLSDRLSKRSLLMFTQSVIGAAFAVIGVLIALDVITIWLLVLATLAMGGMFAIMGPTRQAWVGDLLDGDLRSNGIALQQIMMNATRIVGPLLAGGMVAIAVIGTAGVYFTMAALFAVVAVLLAFMQPTRSRQSSAPTSVFADIKDGLSYIRHEPQLRLLTLVFVGIVLSGFSYQTLMPGFLENELGQPSSQLGLLYGTSAVGGIVTTIVLAPRRPNADPAFMLLFGAVLAVSLLLLAAAPNYAVALGVALLLGASSSGFQLLNNVNLMERTRPEYLGRVMAVTMMAFGFNSVFAYPVGALADAVGERPTMVVLAGACFGVIALALALSRTPAYREALRVARSEG